VKKRKHCKEIPHANLQWTANLRKNKELVENAASKEITRMKRMKPTNKPWKNQASIASETSLKGRETQNMNVQKRVCKATQL